MALISCPECGQQISDQATQCIHCGYPLHKTEQPAPAPKEEQTNTLFSAVLVGFNPAAKIKIIKFIRLFMGYGLAEAKEFVENTPSIIAQGLTRGDAESLKRRCEAEEGIVEIRPDAEATKPNPIMRQVEIKEAAKNTVTCPRCGSTAITTGNRGFSIVTGFLGSGKTVNRCGNCGYKWEPKG